MKLILTVVLLGFLSFFLSCSNNYPSGPPQGPTGTKTIPKGDNTGGGGGTNSNSGEYEIVDEECGGTEREDYPSYFTTPMFRDLSRQGNTAYLVDGSHLWMIDLTDARNPKVLRRWGPVGHTIKVKAINTVAYLSAVDQGLVIVDTVTGTVMGTYVPKGYVMDAYVRPPYAYLAAGAVGLKVLDISNPAVPVEIGSLSTPGYAAGLYVSGSTAYIAGCGYLNIVNISNPGAPSLLSSISIPGGNAKDVYADGGYAFVADDGYGLYAVDARVPTAPVIADGYDITTTTGFYVNGVVVSQGYAYLASGDMEMTSINVSNPYNLIRTETTPVDPVGIALSGTTVYSLGNYHSVGPRQMDAFDISTPGLPRHLSTLSQPLFVTSIAGYGTYALALHEEKGLFVIDAATHAVVGTYVPPVHTIDIKTGQGYAVLRNINKRVSIVSLSSPSTPALTAAINGIAAWSYALTGDKLFIYGSRDGEENNKIFIYSLALPSAPSLLGSFDMEYGFRITASGDYLYVEKGGEIVVMNISAPSSPQTIATFTTPSYCADYAWNPPAWDSGLFTENGVLYLSCEKGSYSFLGYGVSNPYVEAYDVGDPRHPRFMDSVDLPQGTRTRVSAHGDLLIVLTGDNNAYSSILRLYQRIRGRIPGVSGSFLKYFPFGYSGYNGTLAASGTNLYIFDDGHRVRIMDISFPLILREKALVDVP